MIISKTPFRISLFGGSTDYKSFYSEHGSLLIGFAIDKYCYITVRNNPTIFDFKTKVSYSTVEIVNDNANIKHDGVRGVIDCLNLKNERLEIACFNDLPAQTGVGSSSSFVVGLINALSNKSKLTAKELAKYAIYVEREHLKESGGIQDQIWAAFGGLNSISIKTNGEFNVRPLPVSGEFIKDFMENTFLIYTGNQRKSFKIASSHDTGSKDANKQKILQIAKDGYKAFCDEDKNRIGRLLKDSWESKKKISDLICSKDVDDMMDVLYKSGMIGGKLIGSGGSGFIFGITKDRMSNELIKDKFRKDYVDFKISKEGSRIINE